LTTATPSDNYNFTAAFRMPRRQKITEPGLAKQQIQSDAILFSMNDAPVLKPFGHFREEGQGVSHIGM
jgi:gentisate 1,2-dioxygenase